MANLAPTFIEFSNEAMLIKLTSWLTSSACGTKDKGKRPIFSCKAAFKNKGYLLLIYAQSSIQYKLYLCKVSESWQISEKIPVFRDFTGILEKYQKF